MRVSSISLAAKVVFPFALMFGLSACGNMKDSHASASEDDCLEKKIGFDLSDLDENGLQGKKGGKTYLDYEFCIPRNEERKNEVLAINSDLQILPGKGRIGCDQSQYLCLGNTGSVGFRDVLCALSRLDFVQQIEPTYWE